MKLILFLTLVFFGVALVVRFSQTPPGQRPIGFIPYEIPQAGVSESAPAAAMLLPDLEILAPSQLYLRSLSSGRALRYNTTFVNKGRGPLEIIGHSDEANKVTYAAQYIKQENGPGTYRDIGKFVYHPEHNHWHVEAWAQYQFWSIKPDGQRDQLLLTSDKQSFCIWDEGQYDLSLEKASPKRNYFFTCDRQIQGMSVGWSDTYRANVEGQQLDLGKLGDGIYIFRSLINPDRKILESNYDNNEIQLYLEISGNQVRSRSNF